MQVNFTHEYPPIPDRNHDWRAGFDGREEEGRDGWGSTKFKAALDLYHQCETPEETLACIAALLRADLDGSTFTPDGTPFAGGYRAGMENAVRLIEGIE